jgi:hypothetical protein
MPGIGTKTTVALRGGTAGSNGSGVMVSMTPPQSARTTPPTPPWALCLAGAVALAVAMGIGRFAFTPLLPLMMRDGLVDAANGALLAGANYAGYLIGALTAARLARHPARLLRLALPAIALFTAAATWLPGMPAWLAWRFGAGVCSAWVLVAATSWSQIGRAHV